MVPQHWQHCAFVERCPDYPVDPAQSTQGSWYAGTIQAQILEPAFCHPMGSIRRKRLVGAVRQQDPPNPEEGGAARDCA
jgi:hypothetical protein